MNARDALLATGMSGLAVDVLLDVHAHELAEIIWEDALFLGGNPRFLAGMDHAASLIDPETK